MDINRIITTIFIYLDIVVVASMANPTNMTQLLVEVSKNDTADVDQTMELTQFNTFRDNVPQNEETRNYSGMPLLRERTNSSDDTKQSLSSRPPACPLGFTRHKDSCYHLIGLSELTWLIANTYCQMHGSKLVEINNEAEQRLIDSMIEANKEVKAYWIGATNRLGKGNWRWESNLEPLTFSLWVSEWNGWVDEIESPSCALIDTSEYNQWMFWPCEHNFYMTGKKRANQTGIGLICEKESPRPSRPDRQSKSKRKRRLRKKNRRNFLQTRHWRRFQ